jgi:hypothetical protein
MKSRLTCTAGAAAPTVAAILTTLIMTLTAATGMAKNTSQKMPPSPPHAPGPDKPHASAAAEYTWHGITAGHSTEADLRTALGKPEAVNDDVTLGQRSGLRNIDYEKPESSWYVASGIVVVISIIPPDDDDRFPSTKSAWIKRYGEPEKHTLTNRCKNCRIYVYGERGFAATFNADQLELIDLFAPMRADDFLRTYVRPRTKFTK